MPSATQAENTHFMLCWEKKKKTIGIGEDWQYSTPERKNTLAKMPLNEKCILIIRNENAK